MEDPMKNTTGGQNQGNKGTTQQPTQKQPCNQPTGTGSSTGQNTQKPGSTNPYKKDDNKDKGSF